MDNAGPNHAAYPGQAGATVVQQGVDDGAGLVAGRWMHGDAGRFVDDDQVGVFEQDRERDVLRAWFRGDRRWNFDPVAPGHHLGRAVEDLGAVAADPALGDQRLEAGA